MTNPKPSPITPSEVNRYVAENFTPEEGKTVDKSKGIINNGKIGSVSDTVTLYRDPHNSDHFSTEPFVPIKTVDYEAEVPSAWDLESAAYADEQLPAPPTTSEPTEENDSHDVTDKDRSDAEACWENGCKYADPKQMFIIMMSKSLAYGRRIEARDRRIAELVSIPPPTIGGEGADILDEMVRDFTQMGSRTKSEVRRRIQEYATLAKAPPTPSLKSPFEYGSGSISQDPNLKLTAWNAALAKAPQAAAPHYCAHSNDPESWNAAKLSIPPQAAPLDEPNAAPSEEK